MKKRFALIPAVREQECDHEHWHYRGEIPCTGPRVCNMCGEILPESEGKEVSTKRHYQVNVVEVYTVDVEASSKEEAEALAAEVDRDLFDQVAWTIRPRNGNRAKPGATPVGGWYPPR